MNKLYKDSTEKKNLNSLHAISKRISLFLIALIAFSGFLQAQNVTIGASNYTTLKGAFDAINAGTHTGAVIVNVNLNTTETAMAVLNSSGTGAASYTSVLVRPTANVTVSGNLGNAVIQLLGADNVTIDGLNGASQLTVNNTSTSVTASVIWIASASAVNGATNNIVRNCIITGNGPTTTGFGISSSGNTSSGSVAETANSNNTYQGNTIRACQAGIAIAGPAGNESGNVISNNTIGSIVAGNKLGFTGIGIAQQQNVLISSNTILGVTSTSGATSFQTSGILVRGSISGGLIERNTISDIKMADFWGCSGILLQSTSAANNLTIANNFIYDVTAGGYVDANSIDDGGYGLSISSGSGYNIYFNSIDMSTNMTGSSSNPNLTISAALWIGPALTGTNNIRNNIFANRQTTGIRYAVYSNSSNSVFSAINFNDYFSVAGTLGFLGSARANITAWQSATGQDASSLSVDPVFVSVTNLHLQGTSPLDGFATPIAGITNDIDGNVRNVTNPDMGADEFTPPNCSTNIAGIASASNLSICASGSATLSATGFSLGDGMSYQWQFSTDGFVTPQNLVGQTNPNSASIGTIGVTTQYRLRVSCANCCGGATAYTYSNVLTITVNNPLVSGTTPASRCGVGTVSLAATASSGTLNWYTTATGGTSLFTGSPFVTPVISNTTTYYVAASTSGSTVSGGKVSTTGADGGYSGIDAELIFNATAPFTLQSVKMYPQGVSSVTIQALTTLGALIPGCSYTINFTGATSTGIVVPLNFSIPAGTGHRLVMSNNSTNVAIWRDFTGNSFPYALGTFGSITGGRIGTIDVSTYYYFYDWQVVDICEGLRTPVVATITNPPLFTSVSPAAGPSRTICAGSTVNLNVTSANGGYVYTWNPGSLNGAAQSVTPAITTTYTVTANDGVCRRDSAIVITVNPTPSNITVSPATATACAGTIIPITVSGGQLINQSLFSENFETFPLTQFTTTGSGVTANPNTTYYQQGTQSVHLTHGNIIDGQLAMTNSINLTGITNPKLSFYQICATEGSWDFGYIQYSVDGGTNWSSFPQSSYLGTGTLYNGVVSFDKTSYFDWNAQITSTASNPGTAPATSLWKLETIDLSAYSGTVNFKVRFRLTADDSQIYYGWLIDNVNIIGDGQAPITWTPTGAGAELYSNAIATLLYVPGTPATTVYSKPTVNQTYTATATGGVGCNKTGTSTITVTATAPASVTIAASGSTTICQGESITFTATTVNGGGNPGFRWLVNGVQVNLPNGFNQNPGHNPYTINGLNDNDVVTCQIFSNGGGCISPNTALSAGITVSVNPKPTVSINGPLTVCFPANLTLTTTGTISTYQWFLNGNPVGINAPTYSALTAGTYTCIVTSNLGCKDTSAPKVLTEQTYTITPTVTNGTISPSVPVVVNCGANQTFTYAANPGGYQVCDVLIDGVSIGIQASPYTFNNVTADHTIEVVFCIPGCITPSIAIAGSDDSICANANYTLGGSISGPPLLTATWSSSGTGTFNPNNVFGTALNYTPSAADILAGTVNITLTTNNPSGPPCAPAIASMTLTIKPIPAITVTGLLGICSAPATNTTLTASATIPSGTITGYQWFNNVPALIGSAASQLITATGNYSVTANASNGCSNSSPVTIIAFTNPSAPTISGSGTLCVGTTTDLTATVVSPGNSGATIPASGYQWYNPGIIAGANNQIYTVNTNATYTVTATNSNGCTSSSSVGFPVAFDNSPMNGVYTIGVGPATCTNFISFATAINALNTRTIGGNVRFDVPANYVETAPSLGLALGSAALNPTTAGFTITFNKNGVGANPLINAYSGGTATSTSPVPDGIWSLRGVDNVTINNIDLFDGNTTNPSTMEYGFGLFKLSATDGAQNNTIQNCNITLRRVNDVLGSPAVPMPDGSIGILVMNSLATTANAAITPTAASGTNSNNKFYSNTIQNCMSGIVMMGFPAISPFTLGDTGNDVGGSGAGTGNNILNYGGIVATTAKAVGVRAANQWSLNISNNIINNNNGSGVNHTNELRGIWGQSGTSASVTINNNSVTVNSNAVGALVCSGIENAIGSTPSGNTVSISNNSVTGSYTTATTGSMTGILNAASAANINMNGNTVQNFSFPASTGNWIGINNSAGAGVTNININNNILQNCTVSNTGTFQGISNTVSGAVNLSMTGNTMTGISKSAITTLNLMASSGSTNATINNNVISNNTITAGAAAVTVNCFLGGAALYTFNNNLIYNIAITGITSGTATLSGYNNALGAAQDILTNNTIRKLYITGTSTLSTHVIHGIFTSTAVGSIKNISFNNIDSLYTSSTLSASIYAIRNTKGLTVNIFKNNIHSLFPGQSGVASIATAMRIESGTTVNIYNNFINLDLSQAFAPASNSVLTGSDALKGLEIVPSTAVTINVYYNTIRLAGNGNGALFGSSAVSVFNATPTVNLRNNILVNITTPGGVAAPAAAVAYRRPGAVGATYASTSNNNLFYAGVPSASHLLYYDGATGYQTLATYQAGAGIAPRESASVSLMPNFISTTNLHLIPGSNCSTDGAAAPIAGYSDDYDTDPRDVTTPDIGADEFTGTGVGVGVWKGINTNWNDILNWCDAIPDAKTNVTIPAAVANYPVITTATPVVNNISIIAGGSVTITGAGKLSIYGTIANAGTFNVVDGTIEMAGSNAQTIPANVFQNNDLKNLVISNSAASPGVSLGGTLNLYGKLSFGGSNRTFTTADNLVLKSNAAGTASVGDITNAGANSGNSITGNVSVERFITARRAWRFLSVPTQNNLQTIKEAWQENMPANSTAQSTPAGYGIHITKDSANWAAYGFDLRTTPGPSLKYFVPASGAWKGVTSTVDVPGVNNGRFVTGTGYMVLVRGDRSANLLGSPVTTTTLRDKGSLVTGTYGPVAVGAGQFAAIGNPYASAVNFASASLGKSNLQDVYYLWDPYLGTLGGYVTFAGPSYNPTASVSYTSNKFIESGQAFFVRSAGPAGSLTFNEGAKVDGSYLVTRPAGTESRFKTNLYLTDSSGRHLYDGTVAEFDGSYSNEVNEHDAEKMTNFGENLGIKLGDKLLSVERRSYLQESDTIFYNLSQVRAKTYQFEFVAEHIDPTGLGAFLEDRYLNTQTPVSLTGTTVVDFSVINEPGSYASDRFRIVFKQAAPVPVTFTSIRASKHDRNSIAVEWKVENELNIHHYELERSADGRNFSKVNEQSARGTGSGAALVYNWLDTNPLEGDNFYRVRSVGIASDSKLSQVVKVNMGKLPSEITVYPTPVNEDGVVYISLSNKPAGNYQVSLVNSKGQVMLKKVLNHAGGSSVYSITMEKYMSHGSYMLNVAGDDNIKLTFKVVY